MAHALLSASSAHRWLNCPPSVRLEENFPDTTSDFAKEGSLAHELAELKVRKYFLEPMSTRSYNAKVKKLKADELWDDEMLKHTETYLEYIQQIVHSYDIKPYVAVEKTVRYTDYAPEGFGTADCIIIARETLYVVDFKYGRGVLVSAEKNPQMMLYGLGAYTDYSFLHNIKKIKMAIVQPRLNSISEYEMSIEELLSWGEQIKPVAELAYKGEGDYLAGEHCKFCRARSQCRARAEENIKLAGFIDKLPPLISNEEVGEFLTRGKDIAKWVKDLEEYALKECLAGNEVAGFKAVEGRTTRAFVDMDKAFEILKASGIDEAMLYERKPLTLAQCEKVIGKKEFGELVGDHIVKSPGKPTLVTENDKRDKITNKIKATEVF